MQFGGQNRIRKTVHAIGVAALSLALVLSSTPAWAIEESESDAVLEVTDDFAGDTQEEEVLPAEAEPVSGDVRLDPEAEPEAMVYDEDVAVDEESLPDESASDTQEELFDEPKPEEAGEPLATTEPLPGDQAELPEDEADAVLLEDGEDVPQRVSGYDTYGTARSIAIGTQYSANLTNSSDEDWYKFTAPSAGYFTLTFGKTYDSSGNWSVYLYDSAVDDYITYWSFDANNNRTDTTQRIGLPAGTYYLKVRENWSFTSTPYSIKVNFTKSGVWERETANDEWTGSLGMKLGTAYNGTTYDSSDEDWYKFTAPSAGYFTLTFGKTYDSSGNWSVYLYDSAVDDYIMYWSFDANNKKSDFVDQYLQKGTYYLKVRENWSFTSTPYSIKVAKTKAKNTLTAKGKTKKVSAKKLKKRALTLSKCIKVSKAKGTVTYKKVSGSKRLTVNTRTGKITVKKKTKKGTYTIKVKVTAAGNASYKAASKTVKVKVKVK